MHLSTISFPQGLLIVLRFRLLFDTPAPTLIVRATAPRLLPLSCCASRKASSAGFWKVVPLSKNSLPSIVIGGKYVDEADVARATFHIGMVAFEPGFLSNGSND